MTIVAKRAGITKQAMGRIAAELVEAGYVEVKDDPEDGRARLLKLTEAGERLMLDSLQIMDSLENCYRSMIGPDRLGAVLGGLADFVADAEQD